MKLPLWLNKWFLDQEKKWNNAKAVVAQMKRGEWDYIWSDAHQDVYKLQRKKDGLHMWVANGAWFVETFPKNGYCSQADDTFGVFFKHYVWWAGARKIKKEGRRANKPKSQVVDIT